MSKLDDMQWCIDNARATNAAIVHSIQNQVETITTRFTNAGMTNVYAKKLAEKCVQNALYDIQTDLGGW
jgi:hypothetical protein